MSTQAATSPVPVLSPRRCQIAHAWLAADVYATLEREASRRGYDHPDQFTADLIETIVLDKLFDAVLG